MNTFVSRSDVERAGLRGSLVEYDGNGMRAQQLNSFWLYVDEEDEGYTPHALKDGYWEAWITFWMDKNVSDNSTVIDIGANHGYYTFFLASKGCEVYAVEPQPRLYKLIMRSKRVNGFGNVYVYPEAISDKMGTINMMVPTNHGMNATISNQFSYAPNGYTTIEVPTSRLDDWIISPDFIKVDAEGAEDLIWAGSHEFRKKNPNTVWLIEWRYDRYKNPEEFAPKLFEDHSVWAVQFDGSELPISQPDTLYTVRHEDWMLVLRPKQ